MRQEQSKKQQANIKAQYKLARSQSFKLDLNKVISVINRLKPSMKIRNGFMYLRVKGECRI